MDFNTLKQKAIKFKNDTIESGAKKLSQSSIVIKTLEDLDKHISKSKNTIFKDEKTGETKTFTKYSIVIFAEKDSNFYKDALIQLPILITKTWSSGIALKISNIALKELKKYKISINPSLVLFSNEKLLKIVDGEQNIKTIVKTLDLDIIKAIENIK